MSWFDWELDTVAAWIVSIQVTLFISFYHLHKNQEEMKRDIKNIMVELRKK